MHRSVSLGYLPESFVYYNTAMFYTGLVSGDQLFSLVWNAVSWLENMDFLVLALCCDGLAANRNLIRLHDAASKILVHKVVNP